MLQCVDTTLRIFLLQSSNYVNYYVHLHFAFKQCKVLTQMATTTLNVRHSSIAPRTVYILSVVAPNSSLLHFKFHLFRKWRTSIAFNSISALFVSASFFSFLQICSPCHLSSKVINFSRHTSRGHSANVDDTLTGSINIGHKL